MSKRCISCKLSISSFENYGNDESPLCYDCANNVTCYKCNNKVDINEQKKVSGHIYCNNCYQKKLEEEKESIDLIENDNDIPVLNLEQRAVRKGVVGGVLMIVVSIVWFVVGYFCGRIFFYPPILFIFGVLTILNDLREKKEKKRTGFDKLLD